MHRKEHKTPKYFISLTAMDMRHKYTCLIPYIVMFLRCSVIDDFFRAKPVIYK